MIAPGDEADIAAWVVRSYPERGDAAFVVHTDTNTGEASGFFQGLKAHFAARPFVRDIGSAIADARGEAAVSIDVQEQAAHIWSEHAAEILRYLYTVHDNGVLPYGSRTGALASWLRENGVLPPRGDMMENYPSGDAAVGPNDIPVMFWDDAHPPSAYIRHDISPQRKAAAVAFLKSGEDVDRYRGPAECRICGKLLGNTDMRNGRYVYPGQCWHYIEAHDVWPPYLDAIAPGEADLNDEGGESDTAKVREMLVVTRPDLVPVFDRSLAAVEGLMETIRAEVEVGEEPPRTDSEQALGILHVQRKLDALDRREPPSGAAGRIDPGPRTSAPQGVDYGRDDDGIPRRVSSAPRTSVQPAPAQPVSWDSKPTPHGREVKHPDTYLNFLFHLGWYTTKKTPSASNQYVMERYDLRNSLSGLTGEVVLLREEKGRHDWSPERIYDIRLPEGWQDANAAAVEARRSLFSWDVEDPKPKHVALINLVQGDIVLGVYASEIRVWRVTHEGKRAQIANSNTMRRMGRVVTAHHQDVPGGPRSASSELTPAAVDKNPTIVQTDLGKVGIQVPDGTRVFWQVRSTADNDTFNFIGRAGVAKVVRTAAETQEDPWAVPLTAGEIVEAGNLWREVEAASGWDWLPNVCAKVAGDQTGAMSVALGEVLRANGVHAEMRTGSGTVSGTIEIKFREGEKAKVAKILDPDTLFSDSASFKAHVARGNESDSSTDYYSPGGAKLNLSYAADFLRRYVVAVHNLSKRSKYGYQYDKPTVLGRYLWQQHLATRAEREPSGEAGAESGARPTPGRGERKASWSSPKYGTVTIIEGAEGRRDTWNNIKAGGKRYGYNGSRWAKSDVPPADLLAEVAENGWGEMFGVSG